MHSILKHLKQCGPGAIVASATIGAGETVLAVRMGAWGGYELLWLDRQLPSQDRVSRWIWWATIAAAAVINLMSLIAVREVIGRYIG